MAINHCVNKYIGLFRTLTSSETEDDENRPIERYRRIFKTISGSLLAQFVTVATALVTTPLMLRYLGKERYGLIATLTSALLFMNYLDLGIGIGIQNRVSTAYGSKDYETGTKYVTTGWLFFGVMFIVLLTFCLLGLPHISLGRLVILNTDLAKRELLPTFQVVFAVVSFGLFTAFMQRLFDGLQQSYLTRYVSIIARVLGLFLMLLLIKLRVSLPVLVLGSMLPNFGILFAVSLLFRKYPWIKPNFSCIRGDYFVDLLKTGIQGLGATVAISIINYGIPMVIANRIGTADTASYSVTNRLFQPILTVMMAVTLPFWPAINEAKANNNFAWIRKAFYRCLKASLGFTVPILIVLLFLGRQIVFLWTKDHGVVPSFSLLLSVVVFTLLLTFNANVSSLLNGFNRFTGQFIYGMLTSGIAILLAYVMNPKLGAEGVCWAFNIGLFLRCVCMYVEFLNIKLHPSSEEIGVYVQ